MKMEPTTADADLCGWLRLELIAIRRHSSSFYEALTPTNVPT